VSPAGLLARVSTHVRKEIQASPAPLPGRAAGCWSCDWARSAERLERWCAVHYGRIGMPCPAWQASQARKSRRDLLATLLTTQLAVVGRTSQQSPEAAGTEAKQASSHRLWLMPVTRSREQRVGGDGDPRPREQFVLPFLLGRMHLMLSPTVLSRPFSTLYIEKIPFSIAPAAFSKWSSKIENATYFLYIYRDSLSSSLFFLYILNTELNKNKICP
jgi:hypothetical protein